MTNMRIFLTRAIRKTRARALGDDPAAEEMTAALEDAEAFFLTLTSRQLTDVLVMANYTAGEDERVTQNGGPYVVSLPAVIDGENRPPRNGAIVEVTGSNPARSIYVSELADWMPVRGLELTDEFPFGPSVEEAMADMLAARFCDSIFRREPSAVLVQLASQGREQFASRFAPPIVAQVDAGLRQTRGWLTIDESL